MTRGAVAVALPKGEVTVTVDREDADDPWAILLIAHGAGAGMDHPFLVGFAAAMRDAGVSTVRFNFPYVEAGRRMPGPAKHAITTWNAVATSIDGDLPVFLAGKSYGGRMASMAVAEGLPAAGLVYLGYPLHAPGEPDKPRSEHLSDVTAPQLFVEGTKDPFVDPHDQLEEIVATLPDATIAWIEGGGHSFDVAGNKRPADVVGASLAPLVAEYLRSKA